MANRARSLTSIRSVAAPAAEIRMYDLLRKCETVNEMAA